MNSAYKLSAEEKRGYEYTHEKNGMSLAPNVASLGTIGFPGSGKDTVSDCLVAMTTQKVHIVKISMSDLIHAHWNDETGLSKWLIDPQFVAQTGGLQPPIICTEIMYRNMCARSSERLTMPDDDILIFAASGFPRDFDQAKAALRFPKNQFACYYMELEEREARRRLFARHSHTPRAYDEKPDKRFDSFRNKTIPGIEFFRRKRGHDLHTIDASQGPMDQMKEIIRTLPLLTDEQREEMRLCLVTENHPARKILEKTGCRLPPCTLEWEPRGDRNGIIIQETDQPWLQTNHGASIHEAGVMA